MLSLTLLLLLYVQPKGPKTAPAPVPVSKKGQAQKEPVHTPFEKRSKNFGIGNNVQPKRDLSRFVKWPKNVRLQRQRRILYQRLKTPPLINLFTRSVDKNTGELDLLLPTLPPADRMRRHIPPQLCTERYSLVEKDVHGDKCRNTRGSRHCSCLVRLAFLDMDLLVWK